MLRAAPGSLLAGTLLIFSGSPWNYWFLAITGLLVLYRGAAKRPWRVRLFRGWLTGFVLFAVTLAWQRQFTVPGWLLLAAFEALFLGLAVAVVPRRNWRAPVFVAALYLAESARIRWPWGGLPMGGVTTGQAHGWLADAAAVVGEPGVIGLLAIAAVGISELRRLNPLRWLSGWTSLAVVACVVIAGSQVKASESGTLRVATVQGGGPQGVLNSSAAAERTFRAHVEATDFVEDPVDVILWPENTVDTDEPVASAPENAVMAGIARAHDAHVVAGVVEPDGDRFRNAVVSWNERGEIVSRYEKIHRVPFGEFVPGRRYVDKIADLSAVPKDAVPGRGPAVIDAAGTSAAVGVSFEGLIARRIRAAVREGGEVVFIPTNASSYKSSRVAEAQVEAARFRALETGRWVFQASPTGISAIVDSQGNVRERTTIGPPAVLHATATLSSTQTPYVRWGDRPWIVLAGFVLAVGLIRTRREENDRRREDQARDSSGSASVDPSP